MTVRDELSAILDRITNGEEAEGDIQTLRQLLRAGDRQNVVQLGKYNINIRPLAKVVAGVRWGLKLCDRSPAFCAHPG